MSFVHTQAERMCVDTRRLSRLNAWAVFLNALQACRGAERHINKPMPPTNSVDVAAASSRFQMKVVLLRNHVKDGSF